jgi:Flp pilus assembly protein TadD
MLLEVSGRFPEARAAYQKALDLDPTLTEARRSLEAVEQTNK